MDLDHSYHLPELPEELVCIVFNRVDDLDLVDKSTIMLEEFCKDFDEMDSKKTGFGYWNQHAR